MRSWIAISALALGACMAETWSPAVVDHFELVQGGAQVGTPGRPLDSLVVVRLVDDRGDPVVGAAVQWSVEAGGGSLSSSGATTGADGITTAQWDLGILGATQRLRVSHGGELSLVITAEPRTFKARSIAVGYGSGCALDDEGDLWCWGNIVRPSSDPSVPPRDPTLPVAIDSGHAFVDLVAGNDHYCALTAAGVAWCWSRGRQNETGRAPSSISPWTPAPVEGAPTFVTLGAGQLHTCGIDGAGALWCWGSGIGFGLGGYDWRVYPVLMPAGITFARVVGGWSHSCAVATDGGAWCWGDNAGGQLGLGPGDYYLDTPARLAIDEPISEIGAGDYHGCGRAVSGNLYCWGYPYYRGSLGYAPSVPGTTTPRLVARGRFGGLAVGWGMGMAIQSGQVSLWGTLGASFNLPLNPTVSTVYAPTVTGIPLGLSGVVQVSGQVHTACARLLEGEVYCWGDGDDPVWGRVPAAIPAP